MWCNGKVVHCWWWGLMFDHHGLWFYPYHNFGGPRVATWGPLAGPRGSLWLASTKPIKTHHFKPTRKCHFSQFHSQEGNSHMKSHPATLACPVSCMDCWLGYPTFFLNCMFDKAGITRFWEHTVSVFRETSCVRFRMMRSTHFLRFHTIPIDFIFEHNFERLIIWP